MGGSGGGGWSRGGYPAMPLGEFQDLAENATGQAAYVAEVEGVLQDMLVNFNDRDIEGIRKHLETIQDALSKDIAGVVQLLFGGSVSKHTYVNGISDVDMLVCINDSSLAGKSPDEVMAHFEQRLRSRLPRTELSRGELAINVRFSDRHTIQLLPALKTDSGYRIATSSGREWSAVIAPERFARKLTQVNQAQGSKVVPVVKLFKALNASLPRPRRLSGYHIESLAIEAFEAYDGRHTCKLMLRHFCSHTQERVLTPIVDGTGQSRHVDDYLGPAGSTDRRRASVAIANLCRKMDGADSIACAEKWKEMFS